MKYTVDMSAMEFIALINFVKEMVDAKKTISQQQKEILNISSRLRELESKNRKPSAFRSMFEDSSEEESSEEESSEEDSDIYSELEVTPPKMPFKDVIDGGKAFAEKTKNAKGKSTTSQIENGEKALTELITNWIVNFDTEGEQPDRAEMMRDLASSKLGPNICKYVEHIGSLTLAIKKVWPVHHEAVAGDDLILVRRIAENITQVSSILFPPLSHHLKYPNPLME